MILTNTVTVLLNGNNGQLENTIGFIATSIAFNSTDIMFFQATLVKNGLSCGLFSKTVIFAKTDTKCVSFIAAD